MLSTCEIDVVIAAQHLDNISTIPAVKALHSTSAANVPLLALTQHGHKSRVSALENGAEDLICYPLDKDLLLAKLRNLFRLRNALIEQGEHEKTHLALGMAETGPVGLGQAQTAVITSDATRGRYWQNALYGKIPDKVLISNPMDVLDPSNPAHRMDAYILDCASGSQAALSVISSIRTNQASRHSVVIPVLAHHEAYKGVNALDLGANDVLCHGFDATELAFRLNRQLMRSHHAKRLSRALDEGLRASVTDPLTGIYNRRYALPHLRRIFEKSLKTDKPFAVFIVDLDHFKKINDQLGHTVGDIVLQTASQALAENIRPTDTVARIGGDEFLIILPDTDKGEAQKIAFRLQNAVAKCTTKAVNPKVLIAVNASIGAAIYRAKEPLISPESLIAKADKALYRAKNGNRGKVCFASTDFRGVSEVAPYGLPASSAC